MGYKYVYTTKTDKYIRFLFILFGICLSLPVMGVVDSLFSFVFGNIKHDWIPVVLALLIYYFLMSKLAPIRNTVSSYIYFRMDMKAPISWSEAKDLSCYVTPNGTGKWHSFAELKEIPRDQRRKYLQDVTSNYNHIDESLGINEESRRIQEQLRMHLRKQKRKWEQELSELKRLAKVLSSDDRHRCLDNNGNIEYEMSPAKVEFSYNMDSVDVWVDNEFVGNSPVNLELAEGVHNIKAMKLGCKEFKQQITVHAAAEVKLQVDLLMQ